MPVYMLGFPCNMDKIMDIANRHNVKVLEDACQAVGGESMCPTTLGLFSRTVCIPMNPDWTEAEIQTRIGNIKTAAQRP